LVQDLKRDSGKKGKEERKEMRWFISDMHFGHTNIIEYCSRPFRDTTHMDEQLALNWNGLIRPEEQVFVVGDVALGCFERASEIIKSLNGYKILIRGNHDRSIEKMLQMGFDRVHNELELELKDGRRALIKHKPQLWNVIQPRDVQIHGHHHKGPRSLGRRINVCVDLWDYRPVMEDQLIIICNGQPEDGDSDLIDSMNHMSHRE
jgi:calcineurin-like phosphoesterase family protein